jgi:hypothetical protein
MSPLDWARLAAGSALILAAAVFSRREAED